METTEKERETETMALSLQPFTEGVCYFDLES